MNRQKQNMKSYSSPTYRIFVVSMAKILEMSQLCNISLDIVGEEADFDAM